MKTVNMLQGNIYLAERRMRYKSDSSEMYSTFYDSLAAEQGRLLQANAVILEAGRDILLDIPEWAQTYLLPIGGEILLADNGAKMIDVGEILIYDHGADKADLLIRNPYQEHPTSFVQFSCRIDKGLSSGIRIARLGINEEKDRLVALDGSSPLVSLYIGILEGRKEDTLYMAQGKSSFFAYILQGSFEIEGRLLRSGDSLLLWDLDQAELESLQDGSILFGINF
ncbi:hypothetical protein [Olivibacter sitiensis]|uniref:pirin family protein n=1 Tax=Olivibacter sitiensis TaxID=376470 RepID=UPI0012F9C16F|nr:hypothetical protein [Olivibacter sitiensis]